MGERSAHETSVDTADGARVELALGRPAVAVPPFVNLSGDPEQELRRLADLITALSHWRSFSVIAGNSIFTCKCLNHKSKGQIANIGRSGPPSAHAMCLTEVCAMPINDYG
ncbi:MAG: hypothetical protein OXC93_06820 [Rhodospirillaceae bacterium]|nr:hypothetical protein [Rhodospirillaceae bacterium]